MEIFRLFGTIALKGGDDAQKQLDDIDKKASGFGDKLKKVGDGFVSVGKNLSTYVTAPIIALGAGMGKAAMDLEATEAKYNTVFKGMTKQSDAFIEKFKQLTPATKAEARSMASGLQDLLVPMGFMREDATKLTGEMFHVIGALANFNSGTHTAQDVTNAMQSALLGIYKPLASLGVQLDQTTVKQMAVEKGMAKTTDEVTKQMMAQIMIEEVYKQSSDALEAYTAENLDAKTKMGLMKSEIIDVAASFGVHLLPHINKAIESFRNLTSWFAQLSPQMQQTVLIVGGMAAALGPLLIIVGKIITAITVLAPLSAGLASPIG